MPRTKKYDRDKILREAMNIFWARGYESTPVRLLEKKLGINQFSIYAEFGSKEELFLESLRDYREYAAELMYAGLLEEGSRIGKLEEFLNAYVESSVNDPESNGCLVVNSTAAFIMNNPDIKEELTRYYEFIKSMLAGILSNSVKAGDITPETDIDEKANYMLGVMQGLSVGVKILPLKQLRDTIKVAFSAIH